MRQRTGILVAAALASTAAGALAAAPPPELRARLWAPFVRLTAGRQPGAERLARVRIGEGLGTIRSLLFGLEIDDGTRAFFGKVLEQLENFDLAALYETLPEQDGDARRVRFTGQARDAKYVLRRLASDEALACDPDGPLGSAFGDLGVSFRSRKAAGESDNYVGGLSVGLGSGNASWAQIVAALVETLEVVEGTGPRALAAGAFRASSETIAEIKTDNPRCGPEDLEVLAQFRESFPKVYEHLRGLYRTDDVLVYDPDDSPYQQIHFVIALRQDATDEKHAAIVEWLTGLGPLARGRLEICDAQDRCIATLRFSTKDLNVAIDAFVADGKLCPVDGGQVVVAEAYDLEAIEKAHHRDRWSLDFDVNGITTEVSGLSYGVTYATSPEGMRARIAFDAEPRVRVHGSAFGLIPSWAIDVVMPSNMEELTTDFLRVMTRGNDGKGLVIDVASRRGKGGANVLSMDGSAEALNNFLVRLGFKLARKKLIPSDEAMEQLGAYLREGHGALSADFEAFAADGK